MAPAKHKVTTVNTGYGLRLLGCRRRSVGACSGLSVGWCPAESYSTLAVVPGSAAAYLAAGEPDWPTDDRDIRRIGRPETNPCAMNHDNMTTHHYLNYPSSKSSINPQWIITTPPTSRNMHTFLPQSFYWLSMYIVIIGYHSYVIL